MNQKSHLTMIWHKVHFAERELDDDKLVRGG
jgi:hypothetical protein